MPLWAPSFVSLCATHRFRVRAAYSLSQSIRPSSSLFPFTAGECRMSGEFMSGSRRATRKARDPLPMVSISEKNLKRAFSTDSYYLKRLVRIRTNYSSWYDTRTNPLVLKVSLNLLREERVCDGMSKRTLRRSERASGKERKRSSFGKN